jgi:phosphate ABC transporter permease protein PstC
VAPVPRGAWERALEVLFLLSALAAILGLALIIVFVGLRGLPVFQKVGLGAFLGGRQWLPTQGLFGIFPLIVGSLLVTVGALALGTPLAVGTAIFLSEIASPRVSSVVRPAVELLAGIPSVIYGFFGVVLLRPVVARIFGGLGLGLVTGWIVLAIMIVPTIAAISQDALTSVPRGYREGSFALGGTRWQTIRRVVLPTAKIGIIDAIVLGMGRAIGETMAVLMVVGNAPVIPKGIAAPFSTLTSTIVMDMPYAAGEHQQALFGMGVILFVISMGLVAAIRLSSRGRRA